MPIAYLTRIVEFTATHHIARADWTEARNAATFGRAAREHQHRYQCRVTVKGPLRPEQGGVVDLAALEFAAGKRLATGEALAVYFWERLAGALPPGVQLHAIRVQEGPHLYSEYFGAA
jgi:6-pyruvoyl-tetrahydropterin synthase